MSAPRSKIVVLGAGGYIGRRVIAALAASDWAQPVAGLRSIAARIGPGVEQVQVDAADHDSLRAALQNADGVINCVAGDPDTITANALALVAVLPQLPRRPRLVHLSSMAVYGQQDGLLSEQAAIVTPAEGYPRAKREAELILAGSNQPMCLLRPGLVYGPGSRYWSRMVGALLLARRLGDLGPLGEGICNLVHVDDVAAACLLALREPAAEGQVFNLGMAEPPTWNAYLQAYADALGALPLRQLAGARLALELKLYGPLLKLAELALGETKVPPPIRPWLMGECGQRQRLDVNLALSQLGWQPRPLAVGLAETARWLLSEKT